MEPRENESAAGTRTDDFELERESVVFEELVAEDLVVIVRRVTLNEIWNTRQTRLKQGFTFM